jgi:polygalacturonase
MIMELFTIRTAAVIMLVLPALLRAEATTKPIGGVNVRAFGAVGDGSVLDSPAINKAIEAAADRGGGTVFFPAGDYLCTSIHLKSNVGLYLDQGATIVAAKPEPDKGIAYDPPEPNKWDAYQDFGHCHWQNSLIWGENLHDVSILGPGTIWGKGLVRSGGESRTHEQNEAIKNNNPTTHPQFGYPNPADTVESGWGDKAIALKLCRNVIIRDITIKHGGHFAILATGVDNFTLDNLKIDTNRDGVDLDCCQNVRMSNCLVNSPYDDGICPKSSFALGYSRPCENITITNCQVSGYDEGTLLDGTYQRSGKHSPTGRIKFGTESNGGFKNITISNCVFDYCCGIALESVDGAPLEDVSISNITMRDIVNSPIFLRLGARLRAPDAKVGTLKRINISNIICYNARPGLGCIISGIPDHPIEDVTLSNIRIVYQGGGTKEMAQLQPPEKESTYPEPGMFGRDMPSYGMYIRHVKNINLSDLQLSHAKPDARPAFVLDDVSGADFFHVHAQQERGTPAIKETNVTGLEAHFSPGIEAAPQ